LHDLLAFVEGKSIRVSDIYTILRSTGHQGQHGHEFLEFEYSRGRLRYANNSNYRNDSLIRKESEYADRMPASVFSCVRNLDSDKNTPLYSVGWPIDGPTDSSTGGGE
jgi:hypothetical protein